MMNTEPDKNTENKELSNAYGHENGNRKESADSKDEQTGHPEDNTDKYLAMEQPGVTYTQDDTPTLTADDANFDEHNKEGLWNEEGGNPRNSDAFNQDEYMLDDNIDADEDQNKSISTNDEDFEQLNERYTD